MSNEKKQWVFVTKMFCESVQKTEWIFDGSKEEAQAMMRRFTEGNSSPFITYSYHELKKEDGKDD